VCVGGVWAVVRPGWFINKERVTPEAGTGKPKHVGELIRTIFNSIFHKEYLEYKKLIASLYEVYSKYFRIELNKKEYDSSSQETEWKYR
jgi:hypothetical protein